MQTEDWHKVKEIFLDALEVDGGERANFISKTCAGNIELQREVESLLASHEAAGEIYETPAAGFITNFTENEIDFFAPPEQIGNYKIIREIGRGGMGAVFLAERADGEFEQKVAVKIIKNSFGGAEAVRRFRQERQILAALEHPNIARLLDGGTTAADRLPFLVMEFVDGEPLNEFCDKRNLTTAERLKIFLEICAAVTFAHRNLVVHRDLKPSNVLVTADGTPKLLDFGIAKLIDENDNATKTDFRAMTPAYASPEQQRGEAVTTATDVYSLGVILSELVSRPSSVVSRSPDVVESLNGKRRTTDDGRLTKDDLRAIIEKANREEPERRYLSVEAFADDVRRFLEGLPVLARQGSFSYRAEKFIKRNRAAAAAAALVLLAVTAGVAATLWQANSAREQAKIAAAERDRARREQTKTAKINEFLQKMLGAASPDEQGRNVKVVDVLANAERQALAELGDEPEILIEVLQTIGQTYSDLAQYPQAEKTLRAALAVFETMPPASSHNELAAAKCKYRLADALLLDERYADAQPILLEIVAVLRRRTPAENKFLGESLAQLGGNYRDLGDTARAETLLQEALTLVRQTTGEESKETLGVLHEIAVLRSNLNDAAGEIEIYREILPILRKIPEEKDNVSTLLLNLGMTQTSQNDLAGAEASYAEGLEIRRELYGEDNISVADALSLIARLRVRQKRFAEAQTTAEKALALQQKFIPPDHWGFVGTYSALGEALSNQGKMRYAEAFLRRALDLSRKNFNADDDWRNAIHESRLGECLLLQRRFAEAEALIVPSYEKIKASLGERDSSTVEALQRVIRLYDERKQTDKAARCRQLLPPAV